MDCQIVNKGEVRHGFGPGGAGRAIVLVLALGLASCAGFSPLSKPVPVEDRDKAAEPRPPDT